MEEIKLYYEDKEIEKVEAMDNGMNKVTLKIGDTDSVSIEVMPWELEVTTTKQPGTASDGRNLRAIYLVDKIYDLFKELDVSVVDIGYAMQKFLAKIQGVEAKAILNCFGKEDQAEVRISDWESKL